MQPNNTDILRKVGVGIMKKILINSARNFNVLNVFRELIKCYYRKNKTYFFDKKNYV